LNAPLENEPVHAHSDEDASEGGVGNGGLEVKEFDGAFRLEEMIDRRCPVGGCQHPRDVLRITRKVEGPWDAIVCNSLLDARWIEDHVRS